MQGVDPPGSYMPNVFNVSIRTNFMRKKIGKTGAKFWDTFLNIFSAVKSQPFPYSFLISIRTHRCTLQKKYFLDAPLDRSRYITP